MVGVVIVPDRLFKKLNTYILPEWKVCFLSSLIVGFIAHFYKITNWLPNWDSLVFRYDAQNMLALGRWFLPVVCSFSSFYDLPFLNGLISILFHSLGAVLILRVLNVKSKITALLIGAVFVSFPTVTSVMMYNYVADGYAISFFLSSLAAYYMTREKPHYIISILLIALSTGIYQAYITVTIMLVLFKLIDDIIFNNTTLITVVKKGLCMLATGLLGVALYGIILKLLLLVFAEKLLDYQGINSTASLANIDIFGSLYSIKETFMGCFFDLSEGLNVYVALNIFVLAFTVIYYVKGIVKNKVYNNVLNVFLIAILSVLLILGAGALAFLNAGIDYHNLMLMGYCVFYLFFIVLYERSTEKTYKSASVKCWIVFLTALIIALNQIVIANVSYHKAQIAYEKSYGVLMRIADKVDRTEGTENCDKILVIGALDNSEAYSVNLTPDITGITDGYIIRADDETVHQSVLCSALNDYCDKNYKFVSGKEKQAIMQNEKVKAMNSWPYEDCVMVHDGTIIIKLGTEGEN